MKWMGPLLLWNLHVSYLVEDWRSRSGPSIGHWLRVVGEMEAIASLATYADEHPGHVFPELVTGFPVFEADRLGHPLIERDRVVPNDVYLGERPQVLIVSGSNMSGKSTLLRAIGVNVVLALAGAPVCARRLRLSSAHRQGVHPDPGLAAGRHVALLRGDLPAEPHHEEIARRTRRCCF